MSYIEVSHISKSYGREKNLYDITFNESLSIWNRRRQRLRQINVA